ncbi:MAG: hypothetical protein AAB541_02210 [Patescibacteria group bacterium]
MSSINTDKFFKDSAIIENFIKLCLIFGPGFLAFGYFERGIFIELDWFKLLAVSALFSFIFIAPFIVINWLGMNFMPWKLKLDLHGSRRKTTKQISKTAQIRNEFDSILRSLMSKKISAKDSKYLNKLKRSIGKQEHENKQALASIESSQKKLYAAHQNLKIRFWDVLIRNWFYLGILFINVLVLVATDYFSHTKHLAFKAVVTYLAQLQYIILPPLLVGLWLITFSVFYTRQLKIRIPLISISILLFSFSIISIIIIRIGWR